MKTKSIVLIVCLLFSHTLFAAKVFVKSHSATVYEQASPKSKILLKMSKGTELTFLKKVGFFAQIKTSDNKVGFVSTFMLSKKEPQVVEINFEDIDVDLTDTARKNVSESSTSGMVASGLGANDFTTYNRSEVELDKMEKMHVSPLKGQRFLENE